MGTFCFSLVDIFVKLSFYFWVVVLQLLFYDVTCWRWNGRWIGQKNNLSPILPPAFRRDVGRQCFQRCLSVQRGGGDEGGYPISIRQYFHWSHVLSWGGRGEGEGTPVTAPRYLPGEGVRLPQDRGMPCPHPLFQDWANPLPPPDQDWGSNRCCWLHKNSILIGYHL